MKICPEMAVALPQLSCHHLLMLALYLAAAATADTDFSFWQSASDLSDSAKSRLPFNFDNFDWGQRQQSSAVGSGFPATFSSVVQSSKSESRESRTEDTLQHVRKSAKSVEWNRGFQDNGRGGVKQLDSVARQEKIAERSAKELKASESGESSQRNQKLTQVNGRTVVSADSGKQSSFSNSGHAANKTEFSSESNSVDNRLAKAFLPLPPPRVPHLPPHPPHPRPGFPPCSSHSRVNLFLLVHTSSDFGGLSRLLNFLDSLVDRFSPARVIVIFFNRRVLDVVDEAEAAAVASRSRSLAAFRQRLAATVRGLRGHLADECNLPEATAAAERLRHQLRLESPCSLVVMTPAGPGIRVDDRALAEAGQAAEVARRVFDQLTVVVGEIRQLESRAERMLRLFSSLLSLEFGGDAAGGGRADSAAVFDALGRRLCGVADGDGRSTDRWPGHH
ncbi:hypothetical protein BOX15_Mlig032082g1 [Macrostomum lignano]|uniref:VWFA domain-containing protein n=1 Tax=Macrostomum lignano TaxID=282301 RepID=A0A267ELE4_9PLAT|nr:hypothetical protein BOX15_Mlig032082g1 [Macrostomum lignano]